MAILMANPSIGLAMFIMDTLTKSSLILLCVNALLIFVLYKFLKSFVKRLCELTGLGEAPVFSRRMLNAANQWKLYVQEAQFAISSIQEIGQPKYASILGKLKDARIKDPLEATNESIIQIRKKERENNWITNGIATLSALKRNDNDRTSYCKRILQELIQYLEANQGAIYLVSEAGESDGWLELTAAYAYTKKNSASERINIGDGLIGQAYYEKEIIYLCNLPRDYMKIASGLGEAHPESICIVPLVLEQKVHGVIEIASFKKLAPF